MNFPPRGKLGLVRALLWRASVLGVLALSLTSAMVRPVSSQTVTPDANALEAPPSNLPGATRYRYQTHFETQRRVDYEPQIRVVEKLIRKSAWNPFQPPRYERRLVPTVHWAPTIVEDRLPVTERVAVANPADSGVTDLRRARASHPPRRDTRVALAEDDGWRAAKKNPRLAAPNARQPNGVMSIDRVPTRNFQTRSIVDLSPTQFGGVQRLGENAPRVGMQLRDVR